jgi:pilus assembly protein CpaB
MNGKSGVVLLLAIVCGLGAMYGVQRMMAKGQGPAEMREVLVASRDLKAEEVLKPDMVKVVKMARDAAPPGAAAGFKDVSDRWLKIPILADEPIVEGKLAPKNTPVGVVARIPHGMRAFSVEVTEQTGVAGFVLPEHRVDVVQGKNGRSENAKGEAETILEDVLVLAAGTTTTRPEDKSVQVRTVTLALSPDQVDSVVAARTKGPLSLALRGVNDHEPAKRAEKKPAPTPPPPPKVETRPVLVAARELKAGESLRPELFRLKEVPKADAPTGAVTTPRDVEGKRLQVAVPADRPILDIYLASDTARAPEEGMRAVPLEVGAQAGGLGALHPDSRVDVVWTGNSGGSPQETVGSASPSNSRIILQDVRVLEIPEQGMQPNGQAAVTLEVAVEDLATLAQSRSCGTLTLALRAPGDRSRYTPPPPPAAPKMDFYRVSIYRGLDRRYDLRDPRPAAGDAQGEEPANAPAGPRSVADASQRR